MIVSHEHRFIFVRCRKTASTSLEIALSGICGPDDIVTPLHPRDEQLRVELGGREPQNHLNLNDTLRFYNHMPAAEIRILVGERVWSSYFRWCVERNPWDKVISLYYQRHHEDENPPSLRAFVASGASLRALNFRLYTIGGVPALDHIVRYEDLTAELDRVKSVLDLPGKLVLPHAKAQFGYQFSNSPRRRHPIHFGPLERDRVARQFADEIALHGYSFQDP